MSDQYPDAAHLFGATRGAFLLTFAADTGTDTKPNDLDDPVDPSQVATLFSLAFPKASAPQSRIGFSVVVKGKGPIVDRP